MDNLSVHDLIRELKFDKAGDLEYRIAEGYDALLKKLSQDLPIKLSSPILKIEYSRNGVRIFTENAQSFRGKRCIVTVPVGVLKKNSIQFSPPLPKQKIDAIKSFSMESATKLVYQFTERLWSPDLPYMCHIGLASRWWTPGYGRTTDGIL